MCDLVTQLHAADPDVRWTGTDGLMQQAANEIERLQGLLRDAHGAIVSAIATEDGLDGDEGNTMLREIEAVVPSLKHWREEAAEAEEK